MTISEPRVTVARLLRRSHAHAGLAAALDGFPVALVGQTAPGHAHTAWEQVEHMRLAAEDLLAYCASPAYAPLHWPDGYWPAEPEPPSPAAWATSGRGLLDATERMAQRVEDAAVDLYAKVPTADAADHHTLRAALILLDHNGYHTAQIIALRRALNAWTGA